MRDILFKAKRIDNGEWVEGWLFDDGFIDSKRYFVESIVIVDYKGNVYEKFEILGTCFNEVFPETICQYTGLTDKNGNKIWENDVVRSTIKTERKAKVVYGDFNCNCCHGVYGWTFESIGEYSEICDIRRAETVEVIGTIFDNPELMERMG